ncbi:MAG: Transposase [Cenarchaeum symbiont of Oopsacas minuta]|nr:Transposase [Cenarchaeum symbiont of Oopsacas minuta]
MTYIKDRKYINQGKQLVLDSNHDELWAEIKNMNKNKNGKPFTCPQSLIQQMVFLRSLFGLGYRQMDGLLTKSIQEEFSIGFVQLWRRISVINVGYDEDDGVFTFSNSLTGNVEKINVAFDGSGFKGSKGGEWRRIKWNIRLGFIRITLAVNADDKKIIAMTITDEHTGELSQFPKLLQKVIDACNKQTRLKQNKKPGTGITAFGDGIYATKQNVNCCIKNGVKPVLKVMINSSGRSRGCMARKKLVDAQLGGGHKYISKLDRNQRLENQKKWLKDNNYGKRQAAEIAFSTLKRVYGDAVMAKNWTNMRQEIALYIQQNHRYGE